MYQVGDPVQTFDRLQDASDEEDTSICIVTGRSLRSGFEEALATEEVRIVDKVNLYACGGNGGYLDDQWVVVVVYDDVDTRQSNHLVELVATLIDQPIAWHEDAYVMSCTLYMLREVTSNMCEVTLGQIGVDFLRYVEYFLVFGSHSDLLSFSTKILKKGETDAPVGQALPRVEQYPERDLNPHDRNWSREFKSLVSTDSTIWATVYVLHAVKLYAHRSAKVRKKEIQAALPKRLPSADFSVPLRS